MKQTIALACTLALLCQGQELKTRPADPDAPPPAKAVPANPNMIVVPPRTRIPIQLRQPISTRNAQPGDAIYAQTSFPVIVPGAGIVVPAGSWVQGAVDSVKRPGRIKGRAELQFHLTTITFPNGHSIDLAAAVAQVPGGANASTVDESGNIKRDPDLGGDVGKVASGAAQTTMVGAMAGVASSPTLAGLRAGTFTGIAVGVLMGLLARGAELQFDTGTSVEIALTQPFAVERDKAGLPPAPVR